MPLLLANWRIIAAVGLVWAGWYSHSVWDGYNAQKTEIKAVDSLGKGEAAVVDFNSALDKVKTSDKTNCANQSHGAAIGKLLY